MACDLLMSCVNIGGSFFLFFKIWPNVLHLLHDRIPPKGDMIKLVNLFCPLHTLNYLNTVFLIPNPVFRLNLGKDSIMLL